MVFNSLIFIFIFLPLAVLVYYISPAKFRNITLLIISLVFYSLGEPIYIVLLLTNIIINYFGGLLIRKSDKKKEKKKFIFVTVIVLNLAILFFFKYYGFLIENINFIFHSKLQIRELGLPLGLSFYTFKSISYIADVYRKKCSPQRNIIKLALYIAMFMEITAGPIGKYSSVTENIDKRKFNIFEVGSGLERFLIGLFKKVFLAESIIGIFNVIHGFSNEKISVVGSWLGILAYALYIYFDFSGYSDMAIGLGKIFGFKFEENFNYPYISTSISEFWRRWHISLGAWFKEYIYIPLGGNRHGNLMLLRNTFIVWFVTGFWHGASWVFIIWGIYFGIIIAVEKFFISSILQKVPKVIRHLYSIILILIGWAIFSSDTISGGLNYIKIMLGFSGNKFIDNSVFYLVGTHFILIMICLITSTPIFKKINNDLKTTVKGNVILIVCEIIMFLISIVYIIGQGYVSFLYTKF